MLTNGFPLKVYDWKICRGNDLDFLYIYIYIVKHGATKKIIKELDK